MGDPHRLLSRLSDGDDLERELLGSIQRADPPDFAKAEAWARLSTQIAAVALVSSAHSSAAAASSAGAAPGAVAESGAVAIGAKSALAPLAIKALGAKVAIALAVAGTAMGASAIWVHTRAERPALAVAPHVAAAPAVPMEAPVAAPSAPVAAVDVTDLPAEVTPDAAAKSAPSAEQRRRDQLSAESGLLTQARAELRKGDARGAQQLLNRLQVQFPKGVLGQEREVLAIEVLAAQGNSASAKRRAQAFIAAYPESPHSAQLSRFTE